MFPDTFSSFLEAYNLDEPSVPDAAILKLFISFTAAVKKGQLEEKIVVETARGILSALAGFYRDRNKDIPPEDLQEANLVSFFLLLALQLYSNRRHQYIRNDLGLSQKSRPKPLIFASDVKILTEQIWKHDSHDYKSERMRVQLSFILILHTTGGWRLGCSTESSEYRHSNQSLWYQVSTSLRQARLDDDP